VIVELTADGGIGAVHGSNPKGQHDSDESGIPARATALQPLSLA